jgi:copper(I)-binding protein
MMTMRQVDAIELPAGTTVMLAPGGLHIMFVDLVQPLAEGTDVDVTLRFEKAGETTMSVPVRTQ